MVTNIVVKSDKLPILLISLRINVRPKADFGRSRSRYSALAVTFAEAECLTLINNSIILSKNHNINPNWLGIIWYYVI